LNSFFSIYSTILQSYNLSTGINLNAWLYDIIIQISNKYKNQITDLSNNILYYQSISDNNTFFNLSTANFISQVSINTYIGYFPFNVTSPILLLDILGYKNNLSVDDIYKLYIALDYIFIKDAVTFYSTQSIISVDTKYNLLLHSTKVKTHIYNTLKETIYLKYKYPLIYHVFNKYNLNIGSLEIETYDNIAFFAYSNLDGTIQNYSFRAFSLLNKLLDSSSEYTFYIPLYFWFNAKGNQPLPCKAIKYQNINISITVSDLDYICTNYYEITNIGIDLSRFSITKCSLLVEYIYLNTHESNIFLKSEHQILITQTKQLSYLVLRNNQKFDVNIYGPCRELIYCILDNNKTQNVMIKYNIYEHDIFVGTEKISTSSSNFLDIVIPFKYHKGTGISYLYSYSFSLNNDSYQPHGFINFGEILNQNITIKINLSTVKKSKLLQQTLESYNFSSSEKSNIQLIIHDYDIDVDIYEYIDNQQLTFYFIAVQYNLLIIKNGFVNLFSINN